ncbi:hypothetical protein NL676_014558 [Syzygium grande]|nr:hypothetical protein NL676_014558 [Syzygium grande]
MRSFWAFALLASCLAVLSANAQRGDDVSSIISRAQFDQLLKHRNDPACPAKGFYTYDAFVAAMRSFPGLQDHRHRDTRFREVAAFLAQTSHETTGGSRDAPDGPYAWGYCHVEERDSRPKPSSQDIITATGGRPNVDLAAGRVPARPHHQHNQRQGGVGRDPMRPSRTGSGFTRGTAIC